MFQQTNTTLVQIQQMTIGNETVTFTQRTSSSRRRISLSRSWVFFVIAFTMLLPCAFAESIEDIARDLNGSIATYIETLRNQYGVRTEDMRARNNESILQQAVQAFCNDTGAYFPAPGSATFKTEVAACIGVFTVGEAWNAGLAFLLGVLGAETCDRIVNGLNTAVEATLAAGCDIYYEAVGLPPPI
jgi:hypothetical protein